MSSDAFKFPIALITGGIQGIGRAFATCLAKEYKYTMVIGSRNLAAGEAVAQEIQAAGHAATALKLDLTSDHSINATVSSIRGKVRLS